MFRPLSIGEWALAVGIALGAACWLAVLGCALAFRACRFRSKKSFGVWPSVTLLKPVYGLEKNLRQNLRTACLQDYPDYQVVYSVQRLDDPAIPLLRELAQDTLGSRAARERGYFQPGFVDKLFGEHEGDESSYFGDVLWTLLTLELWHREYVDATSAVKAGV